MQEADTRTMAGRLLGRVEAASADATIAKISVIWYALAALQGLFVGSRILDGAPPSVDLIDPVLCVVGGFYLRRRKSRVLAGLLFAYALLSLAMTVDAQVGHVSGGHQVLLAVILVLVGWRGVRATMVHARVEGLRLRWGRILLVSGAALLAAAVFFAGAAVLVISILPDMNEDLADLLISAPALFSYLVTVWVLTRAFPFETPASPVAEML